MRLNNANCGIESNMYARAISPDGVWHCVAFYDNTTKSVTGRANGAAYSFPVGFNVQHLHLEWDTVGGTFFLYLYTDKFNPQPRAEYVQDISELF